MWWVNRGFFDLKVDLKHGSLVENEPGSGGISDDNGDFDEYLNFVIGCILDIDTDDVVSVFA